MKKFGFILICLVTSLMSCTKTEYITITPEQENPDTSTYTIMLYGCGGGNLDSSMVLNIQEALLEGASDRVNFVGQIKFSKAYQETEALKGTQRFIVGEAGAKWYEPVEVLDKNLKFNDPANLTAFINWAKKQRPADNYILILWNHGDGWNPVSDPATRAVIFDDVTSRYVGLSLNELVKGIKDSGTKFKMVYYDACLMGMFENIAGLSDCTDYTMSASHNTPGMGGDYNSLMHHLENSTNFEEAMKVYVNETVEHWEQQGMPLDLMLVNNGQMEPLLAEIKVLSGYLKEVAEIAASYNAETDSNNIQKTYLYSAFQKAICSCYHYDYTYLNDGRAIYPYYDLNHFLQILVNSRTHDYSAKFVDIAGRISRALKNTIICKEVTTPIESMDLSMAITIVDNTMWNSDFYEDEYYDLVFQQKTGWGDWLKINPITPIGNPDPLKVIGATLPEDGGESSGPSAEQMIEYILGLIGKN